MAKGIPVPPRALHIAYIHTPMRYVWDLFDVYFGKESTAGRPAKVIMPAIRPFLQKWDVRSNDRVHYFLANSDHVRRRILRHYRRPAEVIHPPVDTQAFDLFSKPKDYYLLVSALAPYKRVDLAVRAFNRMEKPLVIVGTGPLMPSLKKESGKNISWLGWQPGESLRKLYGECRAFIFPGEEDAGITPLEAQASGRPVVAFGRGGALETVVPLDDYRQGKRDFFSGIFFPEQTEESLIEAVQTMENHIHLLNPEKVRAHAKTFDRQVFKERITRTILQKLKDRPF